MFSVMILNAHYNKLNHYLNGNPFIFIAVEFSLSRVVCVVANRCGADRGRCTTEKRKPSMWAGPGQITWAQSWFNSASNVLWLGAATEVSYVGDGSGKNIRVFSIFSPADRCKEKSLVLSSGNGDAGIHTQERQNVSE